MSRFWKVSEAAFGPIFQAVDQVLDQISLDRIANIRTDGSDELVGIGAQFDYLQDQSLQPARRWRVWFVPKESTAFRAGIRCEDILLQVLFVHQMAS
jgi:hypothetical protein